MTINKTPVVIPFPKKSDSPNDTPTDTPPIVPDRVQWRSMIYGKSGTGKSSQIAEYCRQMWKQRRARTRYITFDSGGISAFQAMRDAKVAEVIVGAELLARFDPVKHESIVRAIFQGAWPSFNGAKIDWVRPDSGDILVIEGLDGVCSAIEKAWIATNQKIGQDTVGRYEVTDLLTGKTESGGKMSMAHFGALQTLLKTVLLPSIAALPYEDVFLTSHESSGTDADEGTPGGVVYGPSSVGKALTSKIAALVPVLLRTDLVIRKNVPDEYRCYFTQHRDPNRENTMGADYPANHRLPMHLLEEFDKQFPGNYFKMTRAGELAQFIQTWKGLQRQAAADLLN